MKSVDRLRVSSDQLSKTNAKKPSTDILYIGTSIDLIKSSSKNILIIFDISVF